MTFLIEHLPFRPKFIHGLRHEAIQSFAVTPQFVIDDLCYTAHPHTTKRLESLHVALSADIVTQWIEINTNTVTNQDIAFVMDFESPNLIWLHWINHEDQSIYSLSCTIHFNAPDTVTLTMDTLDVFGNSPKSALDVVYQHIDDFIQLTSPHPSLEFDSSLSQIRIHPLQTLLHCFKLDEVQCNPKHATFTIRDHLFHIEYHEEFEPQFEALCDASEPPIIAHFGTPSKDPFFSKLAELHLALSNAQSVTAQSIKEVLERCEFEPSLMNALLYWLHLCFPQHDEALKFHALCAATREDTSIQLPLAVLKSIYKKEHNANMLPMLVQKQLNACAFSPRRRIQLEIEYAELLATTLNCPNRAIRRLDACKAMMLEHALRQEHIQFARAYHHVLCSSVAIQYLRQCIKHATHKEDVVSYAYALAQIMVENHETVQSILNACSMVLENDPQHTPTLELLAQCLEATDRLPDAADAWFTCFDRLMEQWHLAVARARISPKDTQTWLDSCHQNAVRAAKALEKCLEHNHDDPMMCSVLQQHMTLEPGSMPVLAKLLKTLESMRAFDEMAHACLKFLTLNKDTLQPADELTICLTLHNLYDCELNRPEDAIEQLNRARNIAALDPRVISTEIDRLRRRGLVQEQIGLRVALIDALTPALAIEQTLELVRIYETFHTDITIITDALRKMNARVPNDPRILRELRFYLRKLGRNFELSSVLEKLARATKDLQARKTILLEASEVHEKLGNHQIAMALYHEACLCTPINPNSNAEFMPSNLHAIPSPTDAENQTLHSISTLSSIILTSRSLSVVQDHNGIDPSASLIVQDDHAAFQISLVQDAPPSESTHVLPDNATDSEISGDDPTAPIEDQIMRARLRGNTQDLLDRLLRSIENIPQDEQPPRILQEIGCIYLYDHHDPQSARVYLEHASQLNQEVANGEQTLNALEVIYGTMKLYRELSGIYKKKTEILTAGDERRKYEIRLAQLCYEHLDETQHAIETLQTLLEHTPSNEAALQLLAQIYIDTHACDKALDTLSRITHIIRPNSKAMAQHLLRMIDIYQQCHCDVQARQLMLNLIRNNPYVDKRAVIELYKTSCRDHDEWLELSRIIQEELALQLNIPRQDFNLARVLKSEPLLPSVILLLREFADVLYFKLQEIDDPVTIYVALVKAQPEDDYASNTLLEIAEHHPNHPAIQSALKMLKK